MAVICHMFSDEVCPYECSAALLQPYHGPVQGSILVFVWDYRRAEREDGGEVEPTLHPQNENSNSLLHSRC